MARTLRDCAQGGGGRNSNAEDLVRRWPVRLANFFFENQIYSYAVRMVPPPSSPGGVAVLGRLGRINYPRPPASRSRGTGYGWR
eukprot:6178141-Pyramimonas_sp.AAC.1